MSDIDEEWKPNSRRPQSTMARSLADALDSAFMLDSDVDTLANSIHYKQQMVTIQNRELEALEARIKETENRLKEQQAQNQPTGTNTARSGNGRSSPRRRPGLEGAFDRHQQQKNRTGSPLSSPTSEGHPSDEGYTNSGTSAATSADGNEAEGRSENKAGGNAQPRNERRS